MFFDHFTHRVNVVCTSSLQQWVSTQLNSDIYWIGLNDHVVEGVWEWSDGKPFIEYLSYVILLPLQYQKHLSESYMDKNNCTLSDVCNMFTGWSASCFRFWMGGQPDNWGDDPGEDCGQVVGSSYGRWNDENCDVQRKYICKHINRKSSE